MCKAECGGNHNAASFNALLLEPSIIFTPMAAKFSKADVQAATGR